MAPPDSIDRLIGRSADGLSRERSGQIARRRGRPPALAWSATGKRNVVERCVNRLKHSRAVATRYDKLVEEGQPLRQVFAHPCGVGYDAEDHAQKSPKESPEEEEDDLLSSKASMPLQRLLGLGNFPAGGDGVPVLFDLLLECTEGLLVLG